MNDMSITGIGTAILVREPDEILLPAVVPASEGKARNERGKSFEFAHIGGRLALVHFFEGRWVHVDLQQGDIPELEAALRALRGKAVAPRFAEMAELYLGGHPKWSAKHAAYVRYLLVTHAAATADWPVDTITAEHIAALITELAGKPHQAEQLRMRVAAVFDLARRLDHIEKNPADLKGRLESFYRSARRTPRPRITRLSPMTICLR
jgi:hypothetical protein